MFMSIFRGKARGIGQTPEDSVYMKVGVDLRKHLHHFKGARLAIFMAIALHADEEGLSFPSYETLERETGYKSDTIANALKDLCKLEIEGHRVLVKYREKDEKQRYVGGNRYLIFPTQEECQMWDNPDVEKSRCGKIQVEEEPLSKADPSLKEEPLTNPHIEKPNNGFSRVSPEHPQAQQPSLSLDGLSVPDAENGSQHEKAKKPRTKRASTGNPNTIPILEAYLAALGHDHIVCGEDRKAAKLLADAGYLPEQVAAAYGWLSKQEWWREQPHISLVSLVKQIGGILKKMGYRASPDGSVQSQSPKPNYLNPDTMYS